MTRLLRNPAAAFAACLATLLFTSAASAQTMDDLVVGQQAGVEFVVKDGKKLCLIIEVVPSYERSNTLQAHCLKIDPKARTLELFGNTIYAPPGLELDTRPGDSTDFKDLPLGNRVNAECEWKDGRFVATRIKVKRRKERKLHLAEAEGLIEAVDHKNNTITIMRQVVHFTPTTKFSFDWDLLNGRLLAERAVSTGVALVRRYPTWTKTSLQAIDVAAITYVPERKLFYITDSEIEKSPWFKGKNLFEMHPNGEGGRAMSTHSFSTEPTGLCYHPKRKTFFYTDDDTRSIYEVDAEGKVLNTFPGKPFGVEDMEGIAADPDTGDLWVACGKHRVVLQVTPEGKLKRKIQLRGMNVSDPEGIAFDPRTGNVFLISGGDMAAFEITTDETPRLVAFYSLLSAGAMGPQAATIAPSSDPTAKPGSMSLYVGDAMVSDEPDGMVFEFALIHWRDDGDVRSSLVGTADSFGFKGTEPGFKKGDMNENGRLDFGEQLPNLDGNGSIYLHEGFDAFDYRRDERDPTNHSMILEEGKPLRFTHTFDPGARKPAMARLKLVVADARGMVGKRTIVKVNGTYVGVIAGATAAHMADGAVIHATFYLPSEVLDGMKEGALTVELSRPEGAGPDDIALDYSRLEWVADADS